MFTRRNKPFFKQQTAVSIPPSSELPNETGIWYKKPLVAPDESDRMGYRASIIEHVDRFEPQRETHPSPHPWTDDSKQPTDDRPSDGYRRTVHQAHRQRRKRRPKDSPSLVDLIHSHDWKLAAPILRETPKVAHIKEKSYQTSEEVVSGVLPLHIALLQVVPPHEEEDFVMFVQELLDVYPDACQLPDDTYERLPLHWACRGMYTPTWIIHVIWRPFHKAISVLDAQGRLPLHHLVLNPNVTLESVQFLLQKERRAVDYPDRTQKTPLDLVPTTVPREVYALLHETYAAIQAKRAAKSQKTGSVAMAHTEPSSPPTATVHAVTGAAATHPARESPIQLPQNWMDQGNEQRQGTSQDMEPPPTALQRATTGYDAGGPSPVPVEPLSSMDTVNHLRNQQRRFAAERSARKLPSKPVTTAPSSNGRYFIEPGIHNYHRGERSVPSNGEDTGVAPPPGSPRRTRPRDDQNLSNLSPSHNQKLYPDTSRQSPPQPRPPTDRNGPKRAPATAPLIYSTNRPGAFAMQEPQFARAQPQPDSRDEKPYTRNGLRRSPAGPTNRNPVPAREVKGRPGAFAVLNEEDHRRNPPAENGLRPLAGQPAMNPSNAPDPQKKQATARSNNETLLLEMSKNANQLKARLSENERNLRAKETEAMEMDSKLHKLTLQTQAIQGEYDAAQSAVNQYEIYARDHRNRINQIKDEMTKLKNQLEREEAHLEVTMNRLEAQKETANQHESKLKAAQDETGTLMTVHSNLQEERNELRRVVENNKAELQSLAALQSLAEENNL